ncbi:hypothetical protein [Paraburkholderia kururiensis]|nr:hypothetical protein [Paraburkholderia kururiensis]
MQKEQTDVPFARREFSAAASFDADTSMLRHFNAAASMPPLQYR